MHPPHFRLIRVATVNHQLLSFSGTSVSDSLDEEEHGRVDKKVVGNSSTTTITPKMKILGGMMLSVYS